MVEEGSAPDAAGAAKTSPVVGGGPLADKSSMSIMSNVEMPPSRAKKLTSGLAIGPRESDEADMKSHSVGNLSSVSVKSLGISPSKGEEREEDPGNQGVDVEKAESIGMLNFLFIYSTVSILHFPSLFSCPATDVGNSNRQYERRGDPWFLISLRRVRLLT